MAQQHVRMKRCLQAIEKMEAAAGDEYHLIVRTRMDAKWFAPLPRASLARLLNANASHPLVLTPSDQVAGPLCLTSPSHSVCLLRCLSHCVSLTVSPTASLSLCVGRLAGVGRHQRSVRDDHAPGVRGIRRALPQPDSQRGSVRRWLVQED